MPSFSFNGGLNRLPVGKGNVFYQDSGKTLWKFSFSSEFGKFYHLNTRNFILNFENVVCHESVLVSCSVIVTKALPRKNVTWIFSIYNSIFRKICKCLLAGYI